jgi:ABC-2 type transport system ATP-binding protein
MMENPKLLLLDEPTNGLDPMGIIEIRNLIMKFAREQNVAVLITSHLLQEIEKMCDRIGMIRDGHLIKELNYSLPDKVQSFYTLEIQVTTEADWELLQKWEAANQVQRISSSLIQGTFKVNVRPPEAIRQLVQLGVSIESIKPAKTSLEDLFLDVASAKEGEDT